MLDDGEYGSQRHCRRKIKEAGDSSDGVDSISSLPDVILQHIFSYIPTRFAIRTSLLSKRWRHVWSDTPSLSFDPYRPRVKSDSINETLARYNARKMVSFNLCTSTTENIPYIDKWIEFAMSRNVENMSLALGFHYNEYTIPGFFYTNSSFKHLRIELGCNVMKIPSCSVSWTSLKKLSLSRGAISDEMVAKILSGCPILESLALCFLSSLDELSVLDLSKSLRLRTLEIDRKVWAPEVELMQIVAPHLHCLRLVDYELPSTLVDVSYVTEASLDIRIQSFEEMEVELLLVKALDMLEKLRNVEKLTLGSKFLKIISLAELQRVPFPMFNVKDLTFKAMVSQYVIPGIVRVLQNSPQVKKLTLHTKDIHGTIPENDIEKCLDLQGLNSDLITMYGLLHRGVILTTTRIRI